MKKLYVLMLFLLLFTSIQSVNGANLIHYYNFDTNGTNTTFYDSLGTANFSGNNSYAAGIFKPLTNGKVGNATYANATAGVTRCTNISFQGSDGFAINYWYYHNGTTNNQFPVNLYPSSLFSSFQNNISLFYTAGQARLRVNGSVKLSIVGDGLGSSNVTWNMHTIMQDEFGYIHYYYNGNLENSTSPTAYGSQVNPVLFCLGGNAYDGYDEMSIYNTSLTAFEIQNLYNAGNGINYSTTNSEINVPAAPILACIDESTYCTSASYNSATGEFFCDYSNTLHCSDGCSNSTGTPTCSNTCENTCNIIGAKTCTSTTAYSTCQDTDGDGCYENNIQTSCNVGEYCQASGAFFATCTAVSSSGLGNNTQFAVTPYSINTNDTTYTLDSSSRTLGVLTSNTNHFQRFYTQGSTNVSFTSRDCDYSEANQYTNTASGSIGNFTSYTMTSVAQPVRVTLSTLPTDLIYMNVSLYDTLGTSMGKVNVFRNSTAKSITLYMVNGSIIYQDYSTNSFDDLQQLNLTFIYDFVSSTYTMTATFDRATDNKVTTLPQLFAGNSITSLTINSTNYTFNSLVETTFSQPTAFLYNLQGDTSFLPCVYSNIGSYQVRTYNNANGQPDFSNYLDYKINVKGLGLSQAVIDSTQNDGELSEDVKTIISLVIILGCAIILGLVLFLLTMSTPNGGGFSALGVFVGMALGIIISIKFGFLDLGWGLLIGIIDAIAIMLVFKKLFLSANNP